MTCRNKCALKVERKAIAHGNTLLPAVFNGFGMWQNNSSLENWVETACREKFPPPWHTLLSFNTTVLYFLSCTKWWAKSLRLHLSGIFPKDAPLLSLKIWRAWSGHLSTRCWARLCDICVKRASLVKPLSILLRGLKSHRTPPDVEQ